MLGGTFMCQINIDLDSMLPFRTVPDTPIRKYNEEGIYFGFKEYAQFLTYVAVDRHSATPMVVAVDGCDGCGRTSLLNITKDLIEKVSSKISHNGELLKKYRYCHTVKLNLDYQNGENDGNGQSIREQIEEYLSENIVVSPEDLLPNNAIAFFIDDIHLLPPEEIMGVFGAINRYVRHLGCIFFVGMNMDAVFKNLRDTFKGAYGFNAKDFLRKSIDLLFKIPEENKLSLQKYISYLTEKMSINKDLRGIFINYIRGNPRKAKQILNAFQNFLRISHVVSVDVNEECSAKWILIQHMFLDFYIAVCGDPQLLVVIEAISRDEEIKEGRGLFKVMHIWEGIHWKKSYEHPKDPLYPLFGEKADIVRRWGKEKLLLDLLKSGNSCFASKENVEKYIKIGQMVPLEFPVSRPPHPLRESLFKSEGI